MNSSMTSLEESLGQARAICVPSAPVRRRATVSLTLKCRATDIGRITRPAPEATTCMAISGPPIAATSRKFSSARSSNATSSNTEISWPFGATTTGCSS
ncbi:hypothetical protein AHiyo8_34110 [Arthrobacter sp. Hiyo8]|nr:hypothetical protein AHiyo8_34110 [Arthrobacter sp. Hiyo8]